MATTQTGKSVRFDYTGTVQEYIVPSKGLYKLEVWGASGGAAYGEASAKGVPEEDIMGGYGGYASGYKYLTSGTILYICVGGAGEDWSDWNPQTQGGRGGYNGGADGKQNDHVDGVSGEGHHIRTGGGGGATHVSTRPGLLENHRDYTSDILLVAGGGGGGMDNYEPDEDGIEDEIYGSPGGAGGSDINPDDAVAFLKGWGDGAGGGYYTGPRKKGSSNYIGGVPAIAYQESIYEPSTTKGINNGHGSALITPMQNALPSVYLGTNAISSIYFGTHEITGIKFGAQ